MESLLNCIAIKWGKGTSLLEGRNTLDWVLLETQIEENVPNLTNCNGIIDMLLTI